MQHKLQYNTGVAMQDNAVQQWWYSKILATDTISNTGKFAQMVYSDFFVKMIVGIPHRLLRKLMILQLEWLSFPHS